MKRLSVCIAFIFSSLCAFAQTGAVQGFCTQGAVPAVTSGSSSANTLQGVIAGCTVTVYLHGTTTLATIYRDGNNTPLANPFTANLAGVTNAGGWLFYAATSQGVDIFGSGGGGNPACTTQPKCYAVSTSIAVAAYPSSAITVVTGVLTAQGTSPVEVNGASGTPASGAVTISLPVADTSDNGYLSSADWNTFNGKQPALGLLKGTYVDGDLCGYTASGTLLNCNTAPGGTGTVTDGSGTTTPLQFPESTSSAHVLQYRTPTQALGDMGAAAAVSCATVSSLAPTNGGCYNLSASSSVAMPAASTFSIFTVNTASGQTATFTGVTLTSDAGCSSYLSGTTLALTGNQSVVFKSDLTNIWASCTATGSGSGTAVTMNGGFVTCTDTSGSTTGVYSCTTTPSFTPQAGNCVVFQPYHTVVGYYPNPTLNVNGSGNDPLAVPNSQSGAHPLAPWTTYILPGSLQGVSGTSQVPSYPACFDGVNWDLIGGAGTTPGVFTQGYALSYLDLTTMAVGPGIVNCAGTWETYGGGTLPVTSNATDYFYLDPTASCAPAVNTTGFPSGSILIGSWVFTGGGPDSEIDYRGTPSTPLASGMTAGQVGVAGSSNTISSSKPIAGTGPGLASGPTSATVAGDVVTYADTAGTQQDSATLLSSLAPKASPTFTGTPAAPTATGGTNTTQLATTAFVQAAIAAAGTGAGIVTYSGPALTFSGTLYFPIGGGGLSSATETNVDIDSPAAVTIQNMTVQLSTAPGVGNSIAFTWRKNASSQTLTCTISGASATSCSDTTHNFTTASLDLLDIQVVTTGTVGGTPTVVMAAQVGVAAPATGVTSVFGQTGAVPNLSGDVATSGSSVATVKGINGVPLCTGFTPTTGQNLQYTTASSPNPCYTAASGGAGNFVNIGGAASWTGCSYASGVCTVSGTSTTVVTISSIPGTYLNLKCIVQAANTTSFSTLNTTFNGDTGSHYADQEVYSSNTSGGWSGSPATSAAYFRSGFAGVTYPSINEILIPLYSGSTFQKIVHTEITQSNGIGTAPGIAMLGAVWSPTSQAAITSITWTISGNDFASGAAFMCYGLN